MSYSDMQLKMIKTFVCKNKKVLGLVGGGVADHECSRDRNLGERGTTDD